MCFPGDKGETRKQGPAGPTWRERGETTGGPGRVRVCFRSHRVGPESSGAGVSRPLEFSRDPSPTFHTVPAQVRDVPPPILPCSLNPCSLDPSSAEVVGVEGRAGGTQSNLETKE